MCKIPKQYNVHIHYLSLKCGKHPLPSFSQYLIQKRVIRDVFEGVLLKYHR
jgi:hypothetical protein